MWHTRNAMMETVRAIAAMPGARYCSSLQRLGLEGRDVPSSIGRRFTSETLTLRLRYGRPSRARRYSSKASAERRGAIRKEFGRYWISVPWNRWNEPIAFLVEPNWKVQDMIQAIQTEIDDQDDNIDWTTLPKVELLDVETNKPLFQSMPLHSTFSNGFVVNIEGEKHVVDAIEDLGNSSEVETGGNLCDSIRKSQLLLRLRNKLAQDPRKVMSRSELVSLLQTTEFTGLGSDSDFLIDAFAASGVILQNPLDPTLFFIHPDSLAETIREKTVLGEDITPFSSYESEMELASLEEEKHKLDGIARSRADMMAWAGSAFVVSGGGVLWYLTYIYFSWDIMEPVTYFIGAFFTVLAYWWWFATRSTYSYPNIYTYFFDKIRYGLYQRNGFDISRYKQLHSQSSALGYLRKE